MRRGGTRPRARPSWPSSSALAHGPKAVIGDVGFKGRDGGQEERAYQRAAVERDARLDGKFVRGARVSRGDHRDDTSTGHIVACFLAVRLEVDLLPRLDERQVDVTWPELMRDLTEVRAVELTLDGQRYRLRRPVRWAGE